MADDVKTIIKKYLEENGFSGLYKPDECGCELADLMPCEENFADCRPGYKGRDVDGEFTFKIYYDKSTAQAADAAIKAQAAGFRILEGFDPLITAPADQKIYDPDNFSDQFYSIEDLVKLPGLAEIYKQLPTGSAYALVRYYYTDDVFRLLAWR